MAYQGKEKAAEPAASRSRAYLGRGVESQAHQQADRIDVPWLGDLPDRSAKQSSQEAPVVELMLKLGLVQFAGPHPAEHPDDANHRDQVHQPDQDQERSSDGASHQPQCLHQGRVLVLHVARHRPHAEGQKQGRAEDDGRVAQREPEPHPQCGLSLADQLAGGVVDDGDVVGVERVPDTQQKGCNAQPHPVDAGAAQGEVLWSHGQNQHTPADHIEQDDDAGDAREMDLVPAFPATACWSLRLRYRQQVAHSS